MMTSEVLPAETEVFEDRPVIDIDSLVETNLPPLSPTNLKIPELLRDDNSSTRKIADAVGFDPMLTTRLLKLANSSLYCRQNSVTSISQAIDSLGRKSVYDIVMLGAFADGFSKEISTSVYGRMIWEHSIVVGLLSRELSRVLGLRGTEEAFLCGLLHDIGKILLLKAEPQRYQALLAEPTEAAMLAAEEEFLGVTHAEVGAFVTHKWELPDMVCSVLLHHHQPLKGTGVITHIVNAADFISNVNGFGLRLESAEDAATAESFEFLKLTAAQIDAAWENIQPSLQEVIPMFQ